MNCISHEGLYDDFDNPLTDSGELYLPGTRICGHSDCVNQRHILKPHEESRAEYWAKIYAEVTEIGLRPFGGSTVCLVTDCGRAHKGRNLCQNHWQMFSRQNPSKIVKHEHLTLADFPELPPPIRNGKAPRVESACIIESCQKPSWVRGLCSTHKQQYNRLRKRTV